MDRKRIPPLVLLIIVLLIFSVSVSGLRADQVIEKSFLVSKGGTLFLDTDMGAVSVTTSSGNNVNVKIEIEFDGWREAKEKEFLDNFQIDFSQTPDDVNIKAHMKKKDWGKWNNLQIAFKFEVPSRYNVDLKTSGGSIDVADLEGNVDAETSGGSLTFGDIMGTVNGITSGGSIALHGSKGDAELKTSGGSISVGMVTGNVDANTSGGTINIDEARGNVYAKTSGGSIDVDEVFGTIEGYTSGGTVDVTISRQPKDNCRLETSGGSINVYLTKNIALDIDAKTSSGKVKSEFDISGEYGKDERWVKGSINGGGHVLYLKTSGGNINIRKK